MGGAYALDFPAFFQMAEHLNADRQLLAMVLPGIEVERVENLQGEDEDADA